MVTYIGIIITVYFPSIASPEVARDISEHPIFAQDSKHNDIYQLNFRPLTMSYL